MQMEEKLQQQISVIERAIRKTVTALPEAEQDKIEATKRCLHELINLAGDAGKVAYVLFQIEYDMGAAPYGELFTELQNQPTA